MGSRSDDNYWDSKYAEAYCHYHDIDMEYDEELEHFECPACKEDDGE